MYCFLLSFLCSFLWLHCIHCLFLLNPLSTSTFVTCDIEYQSFSELTASTWPAVTRCDDDVLWAPYSGPTYCRLRLANTGISRSSSARLATPRDVTSTRTSAEHVSTTSPTLAPCTTSTVQHWAKTSVCREADFAPDLKPHVSQVPAKTGHHECSSSRLCTTTPVVVSSSLEEVWKKWINISRRVAQRRCLKGMHNLASIQNGFPQSLGNPTQFYAGNILMCSLFFRFFEAL